MSRPCRSLPGVAGLLGPLLLAACALPSRVADFAENPDLYTDVPFRAAVAGDRELCLLPVVDARSMEGLPTGDRGFPIVYGGDGVWERPVPVMVGEVLQRQLEASGLFAAVVAEAAPGRLVLRPTLVSFLTGATESISGSRSFAEVGLQLEVFGPLDGEGHRPLLYNRLFDGKQVSDVGLRPVSPYLLVGRALQTSVGKALVGLDRSQVAMSSPPRELAVPAAATK